MKVWKFGDDINTDEIIPARYLNTPNAKELSEHVMEDSNNAEFKKFYDSGKKKIEGDVFVAGKNFGCGSSREHAPIAIKAAGVPYVIAKSFARIFYRNAINIGLPLIECNDTGSISQSDNIEVLVNEGVVKNITKNEEYKFQPIPEFMQKMLKTGLLRYMAEQMGYRKKP